MFCELSKADIDFPVRFDLKIIVISKPGNDSYIKDLESLLSSIDIESSNWREKNSSKGTYISYTVNVYVKNREIFDLMYVKFRELDYIKTVI